MIGVHPNRGDQSEAEGQGVVGEKRSTQFELGYYLIGDWRGKGIMSVAVKQVLAQLPGAKIFAEAVRENAASQNVLRKLGFEKVESYEEERTWPESKGGGVHVSYKFVREGNIN